MILPGCDARNAKAAAGTNQRRSAAVTTATDALQCGAAWWRVEPHAQPVLVDTVDAVGHARQPVVGAEHPVAAVAELAASKQQQLAFEFVALKQRQDRHTSGRRVQLDQGKVDRLGWRRQAARVDDDAVILVWRPAIRIRWLRGRWVAACAAVSTQRWWMSVPALSPSTKATIDGQSASSTKQFASARSCRRISRASDHLRTGPPPD